MDDGVFPNEFPQEKRVTNSHNSAEEPTNPNGPPMLFFEVWNQSNFCIELSYIESNFRCSFLFLMLLTKNLKIILDNILLN